MLADHRREKADMADAFVVFDHHGYDMSRYSVPYIAMWARDPAVVSRNLDTVRTLSHVLLTVFGGHWSPRRPRR